MTGYCDYTDRDLTFYLQVYRDFELAAWSLGNLRQRFSGSRVILLADGDGDSRFSELASTHPAAEYVYGERLYGLNQGGKLVHRMLELFFRDPSRYLFKIDTDTGVYRRFRCLPVRTGLFGSVQTSGALHSIQGGCVGFTSEAAEIMYESKAFLSPRLLDYRATWAQSPYDAAYAQNRGMISTDWMTGYVARELGLPCYHFEEVRCTWRDYVANEDLRYAVTHPCKAGRL